jgi:hypothetical protein
MSPVSRSLEPVTHAIQATSVRCSRPVASALYDGFPMTSRTMSAPGGAPRVGPGSAATRDRAGARIVGRTRRMVLPASPGQVGFDQYHPPPALWRSACPGRVVRTWRPPHIPATTDATTRGEPDSGTQKEMPTASRPVLTTAKTRRRSHVRVGNALGVCTSMRRASQSARTADVDGCASHLVPKLARGRPGQDGR